MKQILYQDEKKIIGTIALDFFGMDFTLVNHSSRTKFTCPKKVFVVNILLLM